ncbi:MAG: phytanoyl-CoA dioxygenase family protein [Caulobacterales bacterium]|nr:phytanoyl-CoA dioxygenase family protein [Caulobacterales bacterium]
MPDGTQAQPAALPAMGELKTHNHLLGDRAALDAAWTRDGYWFFRDMLDRAAVGRLRAEFVAELERQGVIDPVGDAPTEASVRYNGASLAAYPFRMEPLAERQPWRAFVAEPAIDAFFTRLFGEPPFWVPVVEYRATPPAQDRSRARFDGIHQDGPYSPGIPFRICWFPLAEIDADTGGLALVEGLTDQVNRHPLAAGSNTSIPAQDLPADRWRRTTYQPGDVLLMNLWTPHSGLSNLSDRFRLSMDHRVMARSDRCPLVGELVAIDDGAVTVLAEGECVTLRIEPDTYVRNDVGRKLAGAAIAEFFRPGREVIIAFEGDKATVVRPPH